MTELAVSILKNLISLVNAMAVLTIAYGAALMFVGCLRGAVGGSESGATLRGGYVTFARWLIAGLTFLLAADILGTVMSPAWDEIGKLAATAAIRAFLEFFLERDLEEALTPEKPTSPE